MARVEGGDGGAFRERRCGKAQIVRADELAAGGKLRPQLCMQNRRCLGVGDNLKEGELKRARPRATGPQL